MHFPVMILSEQPMEWEDVYERIGHYTEDEDDPMYLEEESHKFDYWSQGGRYDWMLGGELSCKLSDFPMIRPEDTEEDLKRKCEHLWKTWKENPKGQTCEESLAYSAGDPDGPGQCRRLFGRVHRGDAAESPGPGV